jgi:hypothetical protein
MEVDRLANIKNEGEDDMSLRKCSFALILVMIVSLLAVPFSALAAPQGTTGAKFLKNIPVSGELEDGGEFNGMLSVTEFGYDEEEGLLISGDIRGKATDAAGELTNIRESFENVPSNLTGEGTESMNDFQAAQTEDSNGCQILFLDLGPIFLDLLGLELDLSQIELDLTAVPGPGNLLGNLLCAVVGLLDGGGFLDGLFDNLIGALESLLDEINALL